MDAGAGAVAPNGDGAVCAGWEGVEKEKAGALEGPNKPDEG